MQGHFSRARALPKKHALKPSAAFAYRIEASTITPARSQIRPARAVSPNRKPIRPEKGRVQFTKKKNAYRFKSSFFYKKSTILTFKDPILLNTEGDVVFLFWFMFKRPGRGLMCVCGMDASWLPAVLFLLQHEQAALNFSRTNDSGGTRSLTLSPSNQEQRQLLFPSYNYL